MKKITLLIIITGFISSIQLYAQQSKTGPNRPIGVSKGIIKNNHKSAVIIDGVPAYLWNRGCGPTALGMAIGYYDTHGYPDLIEGDASTQTNSVNDAIANDEHYNDYSLPLDYYPNLEQDKSDLGGAHTANCMADFMETSWSSKSNYWGWSWSNMVGPAFSDYVEMRNSEYETYETYEYFSTTSWDVFTNEIDHDRPVVILIDSDGDGSSDHFVTGIGYDESDTTYAIYDTWDRDIHWYKWREMSTSYSWGIYGFNILKIQSYNILASASPSNGGSVSGAEIYNYGQTATLSASAQTGYDFINWTENGTEVSTNQSYSFTVTGNRTLVANFLETSIVDLKNNTIISVYPNPVFDKINIEGEGNNTTFNFEIINTIGQVIYKGDFVKKTTVQTNGFVPGVYLIKLENGKTFEFKKIIKE